MFFGIFNETYLVYISVESGQYLVEMSRSKILPQNIITNIKSYILYIHHLTGDVFDHLKPLVSLTSEVTDFLRC